VHCNIRKIKLPFFARLSPASPFSRRASRPCFPRCWLWFLGAFSLPQRGSPHLPYLLLPVPSPLSPWPALFPARLAAWPGPSPPDIAVCRLSPRFLLPGAIRRAPPFFSPRVAFLFRASLLPFRLCRQQPLCFSGRLAPARLPAWLVMDWRLVATFGWPRGPSPSSFSLPALSLAFHLPILFAPCRLTARLFYNFGFVGRLAPPFAAMLALLPRLLFPLGLPSMPFLFLPLVATCSLFAHLLDWSAVLAHQHPSACPSHSDIPSALLTPPLCPCCFVRVSFGFFPPPFF